MSEENFKEDRSLNWVSLKRDATASAPSIQLFDSQSNPRVVATILLTSTANPSQEFIRRLTKSLESAWGSESGGNRTTEWHWVGKGLAY